MDFKKANGNLLWDHFIRHPLLHPSNSYTSLPQLVMSVTRTWCRDYRERRPVSLLPFPLCLQRNGGGEVPGPAGPFKEGWLQLPTPPPSLPGAYGNPCLSSGAFYWAGPAFSSEMLTLVSVTQSLPSIAPDKPEAMKQSAPHLLSAAKTLKSPGGTCHSPGLAFGGVHCVSLPSPFRAGGFLRRRMKFS